MKISINRLGVPQQSKTGKVKKTICAIIGIVVFLLVAIVAFIVIESFIRQKLLPAGDTNVVTWSASLASYWGAVLGGIVSGLIALGGTFIMINYYRQSDIQNKMNENRPFINISVQSWCSTNERNPILFSLGKGEKSTFAELSFKNIGKGFAQLLVYYDGSNFGGNAFRYTLEQGTQLEKAYYIELKYDLENINNLSFAIMFMDCFSNEYIQTFDISVESIGSVTVSCNYPQLTLSSLK